MISLINFLQILPRSTIICLVIIALLIVILLFIISAYSELLQEHLESIQFLKLSLDYILIYDNSTSWQNANKIVTDYLDSFKITQ